MQNQLPTKKKNKIPDTKCDAHLPMGKVKLPVWILEDRFFVVAQLSNASEIVYSCTGNFSSKKAKQDAVKQIQIAMDDLGSGEITLSKVQKEFYYPQKD